MISARFQARQIRARLEFARALFHGDRNKGRWIAQLSAELIFRNCVTVVILAANR